MANFVLTDAPASASTPAEERVLQWYDYHQNNSGGRFQNDESLGIQNYVQAMSAAEANERFESLGGYFDGCDARRDCPCCGDRWCSSYGAGDKRPIEEILEEHFSERGTFDREMREKGTYMSRPYRIHLYYADGSHKIATPPNAPAFDPEADNE